MKETSQPELSGPTANLGMDWPYFSITPWTRSIQEDMGDGTFEIIILVSPRHCSQSL